LPLPNLRYFELKALVANEEPTEGSKLRDGPFNDPAIGADEVKKKIKLKQ
jgi:hypothetical protein